MIAVLFLFCSLCHFAFSEKPNVDPELLNMLRETGRHEEFAELLGLEDVSLVHPMEGRTEEDLVFTKVSPLGDILLSPEQEEQARLGIRFSRYGGNKWTNHDIPYEIGTNEFTSSERTHIENSLRDLNTMMTNVRIFPRTNQRDYVYIINGRGCYSRLGKTGGQQPLSLQSNGCLRRGTIMHEMMHAMGMMHEQSRPDRDNHVEVLYQNIPREWHSQYDKVNPNDFDTLGPYDAYSCMHYPMNAPNGKLAFRFRDSRIDTRRVGQRNNPSDIDIRKGNALYAN